MSAGTALRRAMSTVIAVLVVAAATGCGGTAAGGLPDGFEASLLQQRSDVAARQAQVRIRNGSEAPVTIGTVSVADPRFTAPAERAVSRTSVLARGGSVDVRIQLGPVDCDAPHDADATLTLHYMIDGEARTAVAPIAEQVPFLTALHVTECLRERVEERATIAFGAFSPAPAGSAATLDLAMTGTDAGPLEVLRIRDTNLLTVEAGDIEVVATPETQTIPIPLVPARCDPHAVQEDKRGTVFRVDVELDGTAGSFDLAAPPELRAAILTWVADWCGYGPGA